MIACVCCGTIELAVIYGATAFAVFLPVATRRAVHWLRRAGRCRRYCNSECCEERVRRLRAADKLAKKLSRQN